MGELVPAVAEEEAPDALGHPPGELLRVLATAVNATRILEIGTGRGDSGVWLAGALPEGGLFLAVEADAGRARRARDAFARAGLSDRANVMVGDASLLLAKVSGPFDLILHDSDTRVSAPMLERLVGLLRPRGLLVTRTGGESLGAAADRPELNPECARQTAEEHARLRAHRALVTAVVAPAGLAISVKQSA